MVEGAITKMARQRQAHKAAQRQRAADAEDGRVLVMFDRHYPEGCDRKQFVELLVSLDPEVAPAQDDAVEARPAWEVTPRRASRHA